MAKTGPTAGAGPQTGSTFARAKRQKFQSHKTRLKFTGTVLFVSIFIT
jgi:hypothetical protein